jgi:hypothetical protein
VGQYEFALKPSQVHTGVESLHDKHHIHIGGECLGGGCTPRSAPNKRGPAGEYSLNSALGTVDSNPVAGNAILGGSGHAATERRLSILTDHINLATIDSHHSTRLAISSEERAERIGDRLVQAKLAESDPVGHTLLGWLIECILPMTLQRSCELTRALASTPQST